MIFRRNCDGEWGVSGRLCQVQQDTGLALNRTALHSEGRLGRNIRTDIFGKVVVHWIGT